MLTNSQIVDYIEHAFLPHRCVAQVWDYEAKLRLRIFDETGNALKSVESIVMASIRGESDLKELCEAIRHSL